MHLPLHFTSKDLEEVLERIYASFPMTAFHILFQTVFQKLTKKFHVNCVKGSCVLKHLLLGFAIFSVSHDEVVSNMTSSTFNLLFKKWESVFLEIN